ncbi:MAG: Rrf2 family transcriptional regulator [Planctomycetes bacterium]|nr:Rrf2 family transcriptional regulator [Planctomycetota bacterium]
MPHDEVLSDEVRTLVDRLIDSVSELETLLLLHRERGRDWTTAEVAQRLYGSPEAAAGLLAELVKKGLLSATAGPTPGFRFGPKTAELERGAELLADAHARNLFALTTLIHGKAEARMRQFADAFRLRKER